MTDKIFTFIPHLNGQGHSDWNSTLSEERKLITSVNPSFSQKYAKEFHELAIEIILYHHTL